MIVGWCADTDLCVWVVNLCTWTVVWEVCFGCFLPVSWVFTHLSSVAPWPGNRNMSQLVRQDGPSCLNRFSEHWKWSWCSILLKQWMLCSIRDCFHSVSLWVRWFLFFSIWLFSGFLVCIKWCSHRKLKTTVKSFDFLVCFFYLNMFWSKNTVHHKYFLENSSGFIINDLSRSVSSHHARVKDLAEVLYGYPGYCNAPVNVQYDFAERAF